MKPFLRDAPTRVHFGAGELSKLGAITARYGSRALVVTPEPIPVLEPLLGRVKDLLADAGVSAQAVYAQPNPGTDEIDQAVQRAGDFQPEVVVAVGGGSAIDSAKILALVVGQGKADWESLQVRAPFQSEERPDPRSLPIIAVPTTSGSGSQCTQAAVITDSATGLKFTVFRPDFFAREAIVDPELMMTLPYPMTAATGFDAFCHLFECQVAGRLNPLVAPLAREAIAVLVHALPDLRHHNTLAGREAMAFADTAAGICLSNGGGTSAHMIAEMITGHIPQVNHGTSLALVYPEFVAAHFDDPDMGGRIRDVLAIVAGALGEPAPESAEQAKSLVAGFIAQIGLDQPLSSFAPSPQALEGLRDSVASQRRDPNPSRLVAIMDAVIAA